MRVYSLGHGQPHARKRGATGLAFSMFALLLSGTAWAGDLPDPKLTPGVARDISLEQVCSTKWGEDVRAVTEKMKRDVMAAYHMTPASCPSGKLEIDHLWSRELAGADDVRNLWPQCYEAPVAGKKPSEVAEFGAHKKDRLENDFGKRVCLPSSDPRHMTLEQARQALSSNWVLAYIANYGDSRAP